MQRALLLALVSTLAACGGDDPIEVVLGEASGQVQLCAFDSADASGFFPFQSAEPQTFAAGAPIVLQVAGATCLSSSCTSDIVATCNVTVEGQRLRVEASFSWTEDPDGPCTDDCRSVVATCTTPALAAGDYTVALGTRTATLTVGAAGPQTACIAHAPPR